MKHIKRIKSDKDYYAVLGVRSCAPIKEIKTAYRALAMRYHPDRNPSETSGEKFREISEAYSFLSDKLNRSPYLLKRKRNAFKLNLRRVINSSSIHKAVDSAIKNIVLKEVINKSVRNLDVGKIVSSKIKKFRFNRL